MEADNSMERNRSAPDKILDFIMEQVDQDEQCLAEKQARLCMLINRREANSRAREQLTALVKMHSCRLERIDALL